MNANSTSSKAFTVKSLLDKLKALRSQCAERQPTITFEVDNQPNARLILQKTNDVEPHIRLGCGCFDGVWFCLTVNSENSSNSQTKMKDNKNV